ncbi:sulfate reduction electron transfer complex DsrMKJOP subunit DsrO [Chloroflexota bacterium]
MARYGMAINLKRCIGCHYCSVACKMENGVTKGSWSSVKTISEGQLDTAAGEYPNLKMTYLPALCMHCKDAPCVEVCPTGACYQREDGIVMINYDDCIGCKYCIVACPYQARYYNEEKGDYFARESEGGEQTEYQPHRRHVTEKCTLCEHRVSKGLRPACVEACPMAARVFGDLDDPDSEISQLVTYKRGYPLLEELGTEPSVYYIQP